MAVTIQASQQQADERKKKGLPYIFDQVSLSIASPEEILGWSFGEVTKPETINYRTQKPERDGLFCERIFGPTKNWECYCGKYKKIKHKNIICDKCGVEVTRSSVRRERMGHIKLAVPVTHIWFLRSTPSKLGTLLDIPVKSLERVVYFAGYIIQSVDESARKEVLVNLKKDYETERKSIQDAYQKEKNQFTGDKRKEKKIQNTYSQEIDDLTENYNTIKNNLVELTKYQIISELQYRDYTMKFGHVFRADIGAEAVRNAISEIDLEALEAELKSKLKKTTGQKRIKLIKRLQLISNLIRAEIKPEWMIITALPIIPPELRPMVQLDGGRFATSDLNDLYRRVINRNNRLRRLLDIGAPEVICRNEKRMLQEAVDALINNSARSGQAITKAGAGRLQLKSLSDMLKGKQGRFRQNLLGKRVDYSGRSVIVVGPKLKLHQCGIPKRMALELFKPFVISKLLKEEYAYNIKNAEKLIEWNRPEVWDKLEDVTKDRYVLLNRAPTLHRLGIQAFQPVLIEGKAIQVHPLVCAAFNADFDGDQMAVHVPLSSSALWEAKHIMSSTKNLLKPSEGKPITSASQDMVLGCYWLTYMDESQKLRPFVFTNLHEAITAYRLKYVGLQDKIRARIPRANGEILETTVGRMIFSSFLPETLGYKNNTMTKKQLAKVIGECFEKCSIDETALLSDQIKRIGFKFATKSGVSIAIPDIAIPSNKPEIIHESDDKTEQFQKFYRKGLLSDQERYIKTIKLWSDCKIHLAAELKKVTDKKSSVFIMIDSGARGDWGQLTQLGAMKGLVASPSGKQIELPIKANFKEGMATLEYFIATHGGRKGKSDTALKTAGAGYLTRRLVDAVQDTVIREEDCGTQEYLTFTRAQSEITGEEFENRIFGRTLAKNLKVSSDTTLKANTIIGTAEVKLIEEHNTDNIAIRSLINCKTQNGICIKCYGYDLGYNKEAQIGIAAGIIAAQSIGEPGTQLTMRTFHMGGVAEGRDMTQGLPRVEELFEARNPKTQAHMAPFDATVKISKQSKTQTLSLTADKKSQDEYLLVEGLTPTIRNGEKVKAKQVIAKQKDGKLSIKTKHSGTAKILDAHKIIIKHDKLLEVEYELTAMEHPIIKNNEHVSAGQPLTDGHLNLKDLIAATDYITCQNYIISQVQGIYAQQGQTINDKHLEIIVRQMLSKARVLESGSSKLLNGEIYDYLMIDKLNKQLVEDNKKPIIYERQILGLTRVSLETESWLSAASFQETIRVLVKAAISKKVDHLRGLKENVIIGKLIPAGINYKRMYEMGLEGESNLEKIDITNIDAGEEPITKTYVDHHEE